MNHSKIMGRLAILLMAIFGITQNGFAQRTAKPILWTPHEVENPAALAKGINNNSVKNTLILNIGSVNDIKGAVNIGPVEHPENLAKLKKYLKKVPKNKAIVIYCGCCPMTVCPNIRPAFKLLKSEGYTNFKVLGLTDNLNEDWIAKGYPMASTKGKDMKKSD